MKTNRSPAELAVLAVLAWMASAAVAGLALEFSGGSPAWAALVGAVSAAVVFWAAGGLEPIPDEDLDLTSFSQRSREVREMYAKPRGGQSADVDAGRS